VNLTDIEYLDSTWNPLAMRCTRVSPACDHCWHLRMARRKAGNPKLSDLERQASAGLIPPVLIESRLGEPIRLKKTQRIGVQFMGDLFHEDVKDELIDQVFETIFRCPGQTFFLLTKRAERMKQSFERLLNDKFDRDFWLQNLWAGVTVENQEWFDRRWAFLKEISDAKVFISHEPALGPLVLPDDFLAMQNDAWYIGGGETGPGARPSHPDWFRGPIDQCKKAGIPAFFKQWGEWIGTTPWEQKPLGNFKCQEWPGGNSSWKVGKKAAGRVLDGRTWEEMPNG
jgi:protein gp37